MEPTRADIKADTEVLVHEVVVNPTNADLQAQIDGIHTRLDTIDRGITQVLSFMKNVNITTGFITWSWNNAAKIGSIATLFIGVYLFFKFGLIGFITYIFGSKL